METIFQGADRLLFFPLQLLFDVVFANIWQVLKNSGGSLILLCIAVNLLLLPPALRNRSFQWRVQAVNALFEIPAVRKGRGSGARRPFGQGSLAQLLARLAPFLLEAVLFYTACRYFSGLQLLKGASFGPVSDLSRPDGLIRMGERTVPLLPILVFGIHLLSAAVILRGRPWKEKVLPCAAALPELLLLFGAPSAVSVFWGVNLLFALGCHLLFSLQKSEAVLRGLAAALGIALILLFALLRPAQPLRAWLLVIGAGLLLAFPLLRHEFRKHHPGKTKAVAEKPDGKIFFLACAAMAVLTGLTIPAAVIASSPDEFVDLAAYHSPLRYILNTFLISAGTFLLWCPVYYRMSGRPSRTRLSLAAPAVLAVSVVDYMFFGQKYGNMSSLLEYNRAISVGTPEILRNLAVILVLAALVYLLWKKERLVLRMICLVECLALAGMAGMDLISIRQQDQVLREQASQPVNHNLQIPLDRSGKNVIVLMMDRAVSGFIPYILHEKPELRAQFEGFTYYPNTISYGQSTNAGSPGLFGGYDYTPEKMNARTDELLVDKHNEALKIMPLNFLEAGYEVTVCDVSLANYRNRPDLTIYNEWPEIHQFNAKGKFSEWAYLQREEDDRIRNRNLFCYSIFRAAPSVLQTKLYNMGYYNEMDRIPIEGVHRTLETTSQWAPNPVQAQGLSPVFMYNYDVVTRLPELTEIRDTGKGTFLMMSNELTHEPALLQEPDYEPSVSVDNSAFEAENPPLRTDGEKELLLDNVDKMTNYHANMAMMLQLGKWLDEMKARDVYDNTRIIIVSDHGHNLGLFGLQLPDTAEEFGDLMLFNALLLVKDFDSTGELKTDPSFMTNADTPCLAFDGLVDEPRNPFLGNVITGEEKNRPEQHVLYTPWNFLLNNGNVFSGNEKVKNVWLKLSGKDLFDLSAWSILP